MAGRMGSVFATVMASVCTSGAASVAVGGAASVAMGGAASGASRGASTEADVGIEATTALGSAVSSDILQSPTIVISPGRRYMSIDPSFAADLLHTPAIG